MEKLWMCRICLVDDVQMHLISETHLQTIYEALTCRPFETEDNRPIFTCYICHAHLQNAYQLKLRCLRSEKLFTQMLVSKTIDPENRPILKRLDIVHPVLQLNLPGANEDGIEFNGDGTPALAVDVKIEHENAEENEDITIEENKIGPHLLVKENEFDKDLSFKGNSVNPEESPKRTHIENYLTIIEEDVDIDLSPIENDIETYAEKDNKITDVKSGKDRPLEDVETTELCPERTDLNNDTIPVEANVDKELNSVENYTEADAIIENDLIMLDVNMDMDLNIVENYTQTDAIIQEDIEIKEVVAFEKDIQETNSMRTGLNLEENYLRTQITPKDNRTNVIAGQCNLRTGIIHPSEKRIVCPKDLRIVLERITLTDVKPGVRIQKKPMPIMQKQNNEKSKTNKTKKLQRKTTKTHTKINTVSEIKSILKNKENKTEKQITKRVSFSDLDKENILLKMIPILRPKKEKPFICDICKKCFTLKDTLRIHIRAHTEERAFKCDRCVKSFHQRCAFELHYRTHTGYRPFQCHVCDKAFHRKVCLHRHMVIHFGLKPYKCDQCGRGFNFLSTLNQHCRIHTGERPHKCVVCGKGFIEKRSLIMHNRIHTDEKPYKCDICKKYYHSSEKLLQHFKIHSDNKPFRCEICKIHFICNKNYTKHVTRKHKKPDKKRNSSITNEL